MKPIDLRLYAIVDAERAGGYALADLARRVAEGGATLVQLRDKHSETRAMVEAARAIKAALAPFAIPFVVNDRVDVALAVGADGVHVGLDDMTAEDARALLGPDAIIGLSIKTVEQAAAAPVERIDYAGIGGVYATTSKEQNSAPIDSPRSVWESRDSDHVPRFANTASTMSRKLLAAAAGSALSDSAEMTATPSAPAAMTAAALPASMPAMPHSGKDGARLRSTSATRANPSGPIGALFCSFDVVA